MSFWILLWNGIVYLALLFVDWIKILFILPFKNFEIFWILIPIWVNWFFAEFFQEKKGTSFGNAISNGAVPLIIAIDWARYLTRMVQNKEITLNTIVYLKYALCFIVLLYGFSVVYYGIKGKKFIKYYGRIRQVTYVLLMFSPVIYGIVDLNLRFLISFILYFPVFYFVIEVIDRIVPDPKVVGIDSSRTEQKVNDPFAEFNTISQDSEFQNNNFNQDNFLENMNHKNIKKK